MPDFIVQKNGSKSICYNRCMTMRALAAAVLLVILIGGAYFTLKAARFGSSDGIACTMEAKLCPDGSYVGRVGPKCEFARCPDISIPLEWTVGAGGSVTFRYPESFATEYVEAYDWPPKFAIQNTPLSCAAAGAPEKRAGRTEPRLIGGRRFCVTDIAGAAAGSRYDQYAYAFEADARTVYMTFTIRSPNCGNYDEPQRSACEREQQSFDIDDIVGRIAASVRVENVLTTAAQGTIRGAVLLGPTCPVVRDPPDTACADRPYETAIQVITVGSAQSPPFRTAKSDSAGRFEIVLPAGTYALQPMGGNPLPHCETKQVTVELNRTEEIDLFCDSGIR